MTASQTYQPSAGRRPVRRYERRRSVLAGVRLVRLHVASRRGAAAVVAIAGCAAVLRLALEHRWGTHAQQVPLVIETATATIIAATTVSPFGEVERATGHWLPYLRLTVAVTLTAIALAALASGAESAHLSGGTVELVRNLAGLTGIALISSAVLGGALAWIGPLAYTVIAEYALIAGWTSPWMWPARPPQDWGAATCAATVFVAGAALITTRGARETASE